MNKFIKKMSALFLALSVFTVNIPMDSVYALDLIKLTSSDTSSDDTSSDDTSSDDTSSDDTSSDDTSSDSSSSGSSSSGSSSSGSSGSSDIPSDQLIEPSDLSFSVEADSTGSSTTVFSDDASVVISVNNKASNDNIVYEWFLNGVSQGSSVPADEFKATDLDPKDYTIYVIGTFLYATGDSTGEHEAEVKSSEFKFTVIDRPTVTFDITSTKTEYDVNDESYKEHPIYLDQFTVSSSDFDKDDFEVEWLPSSGLAGGKPQSETDNRFALYELPSSVVSSSGEHTMGVEILVDHDNNNSTDPASVMVVENTSDKALKITVGDFAGNGITLVSDKGTDIEETATGTATITATLTGMLTEATIIDTTNGYLWTLDGETITGEKTKSIEINLATLKSTQTYTVAASYVDDSGVTQTVTDSITIKKGSDGDDDSDDDGSGDGDGDDGDTEDGGQTGDGSVYPILLTDLSTASKAYVQNRVADPLTISVDPRFDGTVSYKWYVNTQYSTVGGTLLDYKYGIAGNSSSISPSVTPSTATVGKFYYYVEVTNHYGEFTKTTRSSIATIEVIPDSTAPTKYTINADGNLEVADYSKVVVDWSTFDEFIDNGGEVLTVTGAYIQNLRVPQVYSTNGYQVVVQDTGYDLEYSWKIKDGSKVSGYLDLALSTTTSLSGVEKGNSALNYDARYSQVIQFKHEGALTTNDKGITLTMPTTVKDGDGHLNKINTDSTINYSSYVKGTIENGDLVVNMKDCSDWVVSALKLAELTDYDNTNGTGALTGFVNIPTFVGFEVSEFKNVVVGQMIYLDKINMDTIENNRFSGWYYDTAFLEPVSSNDVKSGMLVSREIVTNGLYPKYEKSNSYVPSISTAVPSTGVVGNTYIQKLEALF